MSLLYVKSEFETAGGDRSLAKGIERPINMYRRVGLGSFRDSCSCSAVFMRKYCDVEFGMIPKSLSSDIYHLSSPDKCINSIRTVSCDK